jgi:alpha-N-arabinofuranosidase
VSIQFARWCDSNADRASSGPTYPVWIQHAGLKPAYIDTVAMITPDSKSIRVSVLNRHPKADWDVDFRFDGFEVSSIEVHEVYSDDMAASVSVPCATGETGLTSRTHLKSPTLSFQRSESWARRIWQRAI